MEITRKINCCGCEACVNVCPKNCIVMSKDEEGFWYPRVNNEHCVHCGLCESVCPFNGEKRKESAPIAIGAKAKDTSLRLASSSGGLFSVLAESILKMNGVVFGVAMSEDCRLARHIMVSDNDGLAKLRGSKYLQSDIGDSYKQAKEMLDLGRNVLFSGTPCQIAGLKKYLRKEYVKLLTVEIICHGVASPELWKKYVEYIENKEGSAIKKVYFRSKKNGWNNFGLEELFCNKKHIFIKSSKNPYMRLFFKNLCLRPSCYDCRTRGGQADISLGDLWGVDDIVPEFNDNKGTSLVLLYTAKGQKAFNEIKDCIDSLQVDYQKSLRYNPCIIASVKRPEQRDYFFKDMEEMSFEKLKKKYLSVPISMRIKKAIARIILGGEEL